MPADYAAVNGLEGGLPLAGYAGFEPGNNRWIATYIRGNGTDLRLVGNAHPRADQGFWRFAKVNFSFFQ
jgi:hypothetical protein